MQCAALHGRSRLLPSPPHPVSGKPSQNDWKHGEQGNLFPVKRFLARPVIAIGVLEGAETSVAGGPGLGAERAGARVILYLVAFSNQPANFEGSLMRQHGQRSQKPEDR